DWVFVELPRDFLELRNGLQDILRDCMNSLKNEGFVESVAVARVNKRTLLELRTKILAETKSNVRAYQALSHVARAINVLHASDLLESHGLAALNDYLHGLKTRKQKTKAVQNLLSDFRIARVAVKTQSLLAAGVEHPKMQRMKEIVSGETALGKSVIVFAHYRDSVKRIVTELNSIAGVSARELVGRADGGMTQKKQAAVIEGFRNREFNVLVATSVGEEGLDIPAVDLVLFFEAVPSEIRLIQRRGRAGRAKVGNAVVLVTKGSKDEAFLWISRRKEKVMHEQLSDLQDSFESKKQKTMGEF
ncbi:MAG: helicase-related protein, partial [Candidatus Micrarchaeota archaeon]